MNQPAPCLHLSFKNHKKPEKEIHIAKFKFPLGIYDLDIVNLDFISSIIFSDFEFKISQMINIF